MTPLSLTTDQSSWTWSSVERPTADLVRIHIVMAGLCRTDIQSMQGHYDLPQGRILGHEAAGIVEYIPEHLQREAAHKGIAQGSRVAFFPFFPCKICTSCVNNEGIERCHKPVVVGMDCDGAFSQFIDVPLSVVFAAPQSLSWKHLAYAEPVAAALGVSTVSALIDKPNVAIVGKGRIAQLTKRVLEALRNKQDVLVLEPHEVAPNFWDALVETWPTQEAVDAIVNGVTVDGVIVVKSRPAQGIVWPHRLMTLKRLNIVGAPYGSFEQGLTLMDQGVLNVDDMLGPVFSWDTQGVNDALLMEEQGQEQHGKLFFDIACKS